MRRILLLFVFLVASLSSWASHIVGGEFELLHKIGFRYDLNLILYFDVVNGNPGAFDPSIQASIFRKSDDQLMMNVFVPFIQSRRVDYFQPECSTGEVVTDRYLYTTDIYLDPNDFNDPEGYYVVWQRCCRNYTITNILSNAPNTGGVSAGQTFYLEIPPVVDEEGQPFVNSSPRLFPPLNDYGCPNRPYWVDFKGTDDDGDSLVYSLIDPLSTQFNSAFPPNNQNYSEPYPAITYKTGFGIGNIMNGSPRLKISDDGFLSVTPQSQGLFVFAVQVEEWRDSVKIGEVRRDFQMLVLDKCPIASPPQILGKKLDDPTFTFDNNMVVSFNSGLNDETRCIQVEVSDLDASKSTDDFREEIELKAISLGFKAPVINILPDPFGTFATLENGSTAVFDICFEECPLAEDGNFQVGLIAFDDACALPLSDTLKVNVFVEPPPNNTPYFDPGDNVNLTVNEMKDGFFSTDLIGRDADNDDLYLQIFPQGFVLEDFGMSFDTYQNEPGDIRTRFNWNYDCLETSFDGKTDFEILVIVDDFDFCQFAHPDTVKLNLDIILPDNTFPSIYSEDLGTQADRYFNIERELYETIEFSAFGEDLDNDPIFLHAEGANFDMEEYGASFPQVDGNGNPGISGDFSWFLDCDLFDLAEQDSFRFYVMVEDIDYCNITSKDTVTVDLKVTSQANNFPELVFTAGNEFVEVEENRGTITVGDPLVIRAHLSDLDPNFLTLRLVDVQGENPNPGFTFQDQAGYNQISSNLIWNPACDALEPGAPTSTYKLTFEVSDDHCILPYDNEINFFLTVEDNLLDPVQADPPNVFTPNGDDLNEYFALEWLDIDGRRIYTIPEDNCAGSFLSIRIINRWGREVFFSNERAFKWFGGGEPSGVYYYFVEYTNGDFKGTVSMIY